MPKPTVLLVDNDADFLEITRGFLAINNYRVIAVSTPEAAHRALTQEPVALAVLDFRLNNDEDEQDRSGLALARSSIWGSYVPKIVLTQFDEYEYARACLRPEHGGQAPAVDFVAKKEGLEALLASIRRVLVTTNVFLCYARPDQPRVTRLYDDLVSAGLTPWMDAKCIEGGENWRQAISKAIERSDYFLLCLSRRSVNRRGFIQREIRKALDIREEMLDEDIYLIPVRLEECDVPEGLRSLQWIDLFRHDGFQKLVRAIRAGAERRSTDGSQEDRPCGR